MNLAVAQSRAPLSSHSNNVLGERSPFESLCGPLSVTLCARWPQSDIAKGEGVLVCELVCLGVLAGRVPLLKKLQAVLGCNSMVLAFSIFLTYRPNKR